MGAHSTLLITRTTARRYILEKVMEADDEKLGSMLDALLYDQLYNASIVPDHYEDNNDASLDR